MTQKEFKAKLESHDWYYQMSDDSRSFDRGLKSWNEIQAIAEKNPSLKKILNAKMKQIYGNEVRITRGTPRSVQKPKDR